MIKRVIALLIVVWCTPTALCAQQLWEHTGTLGEAAGLGGHGIAVDPDGKIWYQPFSATDSVQVPDLGDTYQPVRVIYVFHPDGTPASISPIKFVDFPGGARDTLGGYIEDSSDWGKVWRVRAGRGLRTDADGNIVVSQAKWLYKLNYQTGEGLAKNVFDDYCALTAPATDALGNVYVAPVCPGPPIRELDSDLQVIGNAVDVSHGFARSFEVSANGNTMYWSGYTNHAVVVYQRPDAGSPYDSLGVVLQGFDSESLTIHPTTGHLWASAGSPNDLPNRYPGVTTSWRPQTWYAFSLGDLVPNQVPPTPLAQLTWQTVPESTDGRPRGIAFSPEGTTAYVTQFAESASPVQVFVPAEVVPSRQVTVQLNTATLADTTRTFSMIEVRGGIDQQGGVTLPDGNIIDWTGASTIQPRNIGGDYWEASFRIPENAELQFKFYSQQAEDNEIGGWEDGDNHMVASGMGDVDLGLHYFERHLDEDQPFHWRPFPPKPDSVGVWFRVYMNTVDAVNKGYDRDTNHIIGVRGDNLSQQGPLDWGNTQVTLTRESSVDSQPGYDLYSGVAYYPNTLAGGRQSYKFFLEPNAWEDDIPVTSLREFSIPHQDTTLHWVYFSESTPVINTPPVTEPVTFSVDITPLEALGLFNPDRGDVLEVRGGFNAWNNTNPDASRLSLVPGTNIYRNAISVTDQPGATQSYKFFVNFDGDAFRQAFGQDPPSGWEEPLSRTGANRTFTFDGTGESVSQDLGMHFFNDVFLGNIIPEGTSVEVTFAVDMTSALTNQSQPFVPSRDNVFVDLTGDNIWAFTQGLDVNNQQSLILSDSDNDMIYTGTMRIEGPTYGAIQYKYGYGAAGTLLIEEGRESGGVGRRRARYIARLTNLTWPSTWRFPTESFIAEGVLPSEDNPEDDNSGASAVEQSVAIADGWNLVGLSLEVIDAAYLSLYPSALNNTFFSFDGAYATPNPPNFAHGSGYWLYFNTSETERIVGVPIEQTSINVAEGWNLIGGPNCSVSFGAISDPNDVLMLGTLFEYADGYQAVSAVEPMKGYWIRASAAGTIGLTCQAAKHEGVEDDVLADFGRLVITDAAGRSQVVYYGGTLGQEISDLAYTLPPQGPRSSFSVSYADGRYITTLQATDLKVEQASWPLRVAVASVPENGGNYVLEEAGTTHALISGSSFNINAATPLRLVRGAHNEVPTSYSLRPNYPNPFNPETMIRFGLPEAASVRLIVYDVLGRQVEVLKDGNTMRSGWHDVRFDGTDLASGIYVYRLEANGFQAVRQMLLLK